MSDWNSTDAVIGQPAAKPPEPKFDSNAPTPAEVAADVAARQAEIDAKRLAAGSGLPTTVIPPTKDDPSSPGTFAPATKVERAGPISTDPNSLPEIPEAAPPAPRREAKHRMGAFLKIPGGFSGRVVEIYENYTAVCQDPDVIAAGGADKVIRGIRGKGIPTDKDAPFYRCTSNSADYDLVVGEMDAHLIKQGPDVPQ
jgi:hypothetical protein